MTSKPRADPVAIDHISEARRRIIDARISLGIAAEELGHAHKAIVGLGKGDEHTNARRYARLGQQALAMSHESTNGAMEAIALTEAWL